MKFLQCIFCKGELEIVSDKGIQKKVKCLGCGFTNSPETKEPEVFVIRRKLTSS